MRLFLYRLICVVLPERVRNPWHAPVPIYYPTPEDVFGMYADRFGIKEQAARRREIHRGSLSAALHRPQTAAHYEDADFARQAAVLAHALSEGHIFSDGNKRLAFDAALAFIEAHGYRLTVSEPVFAAWLVMLSEPEEGEDRDRWDVNVFEAHLRRRLTLTVRLLVTNSTYE